MDPKNVKAFVLYRIGEILESTNGMEVGANLMYKKLIIETILRQTVVNCWVFKDKFNLCSYLTYIFHIFKIIKRQ